MSGEPFKLDQTENPHPRMLVRALAQRRLARMGVERSRWQGYWDAMCDATGCTHDEIAAWLDRHEEGTRAVPSDGLGTEGA